MFTTMKSFPSVDHLFTNWLIQRNLLIENSEALTAFSIAIQSPCLVCQPRVATKLARYLDEFDGELNESGWLPINDHHLEQLQANTSFRKMIGNEAANHTSSAITHLTKQGGVIVELPKCFDETSENKCVFQVSMSCTEPKENNHHLWLNAKRIPETALIPMIANAFFDWALHGGDSSSN